MGTFMGIGVPLFSDSGAEIMSVASDGTVTFLTAVSLAQSVSSTTTDGGMVITVTSTGALAAGATLVNGVVVAGTTKSVINDVFAYHGEAGSSALGLLGVTSTQAPTYFLRLDASGGAADHGVGAALNNGFFTATYYYVSAPTTAIPMAAIKIMAGSKAYYIPCIADTGMAAS